ncbi:hypothetical protein [Geopseudomonas aromaticivorans]
MLLPPLISGRAAGQLSKAWASACGESWTQHQQAKLAEFSRSPKRTPVTD